MDSEVDLEALEEVVVEKKIDLGLQLDQKECDLLLEKGKKLVCESIEEEQDLET